MERSRSLSKEYDLKYIALSFVVLVLLFRPRSVERFELIERAFYMGQLLFSLAMSFFILILFLRRAQRRFSPIAWMVILYKAWETFAIFRNGYGDLSTLVNAMVVAGAALFTEYMLKIAPLEYLSTLSFYTGSIVFINNLSYFTGGFKELTDATGNVVYFWSTRNHLSSLFFIALLSSLIIKGMKRSRLPFAWNLFVLFNVLWGVITFQSATTIVGIAVYLILYFLFRRKTAIYRPVTFFFGGLGLHIAIVILRVQELFAYFIENLLHRTLTLSGRTMIWDSALFSILNRPFMGYGQSSIFTLSFAREEIPAHNQFLDIGVICGIPGMIIFFILLLVVFWKLKDYKNSEIARVICCSLLAYVIMSITESPNPYQPWFIIFGMVSQVPELDKRYTYISYHYVRGGIIRRQRIKGNIAK